MPVDSPHPEYVARKDDWQICRDVCAGEKTVKSARTTYLPLLEGQQSENDPSYVAYLKRALFYPAFDRTVSGLSGLVLRRPAVYTLPGDALPGYLDDITLAGDGSQGVLVKVLGEVLTVGRHGIVVDWSDAQKRPYWTLVETERIVSWAEGRVEGEWLLTSLVLRESVPKPDRDRWSAEVVDQYREFQLTPTGLEVTLWRRAPGDAKELVPTETLRPSRKGEPLRRIPFVSASTRGLAIRPPKPPLLDLAWVNLSHFRTSADLEHGRHFTALPTPYVTGWTGTGDGLKIGAGTAWIIPSEQAKVGMLEFTGQGLKALEVALEQKEKLMATIGGRLLEQAPRAAETAEAVRLRLGGDYASLATVVASISAGLTLAMQWAAWWTGLDAIGDESVEVRLNADFADTRLGAQEVDSLTKLWQAGGISYETLYFNLQTGEIARPGIEASEEKDQIDAEDALAQAAEPPLPEVTDGAVPPQPQPQPQLPDGSGEGY